MKEFDQLVIVLIIAVSILVVLGPVITIWSLNLLFGLAIPVTFWTWCASFWLSACVYGASASAKAKTGD